MGASPPRLSPEQKDAIYELKRQGKSGAEVGRICRAGYGNLAPFAVSAPHANDLYRRIAEEKGELYETVLSGLTNSGAIDKLTARLLRIAEREIQRAERAQRNGKLDPAKVGKIATALEKLHKLDEARAVPQPPKPDESKGEAPAGAGQPASFASRLADAADTETPPVADEPIPDAAHAVPTADPPSDQRSAGEGGSAGLQGQDGMSGGMVARPVSASHEQRRAGIHDLARAQGEA